MQTETPYPRKVSGEPVAKLPSGLVPARAPIEGRDVRLEPLDPARHGADLFAAATAGEAARESWRYLGVGPWTDEGPFRAWLRDCSAAFDPVFMAIRERAGGRVVGMASFLNVAPKNGSIEIGHIWFGPALQRTRAATEALFLMLCYALDDLGYRRMEWKCNALNEPSRAAARRLGFRFEGIFFQHTIVKGRSRDTAWYSILDHEWPVLRANMETWLSPGNFGADGRQKRSLAALNQARA